VEDKELIRLSKELKLKKFQFNSIYEFSSSLYSSFEIDSIVRIFFSTLMGQMAISRIFFFDSGKKLFKERGCRFSDEELNAFRSAIRSIKETHFYLETDKLSADFSVLQDILKEKKIRYLINLSETRKKKIYLGLGYKFNRIKLSEEEIEFSFFIARFALIALDNAVLINRIIENKRIEHEMKIAKDIQLSLLPQEIPELDHFEIAVIYQPINEVGGDYYDILKDRDGRTSLLVADVEGKGLPAALLAASSQAVFHSLNELYFFEPAKFVAKANSLIFNFTHGNRFITLLWLVVNDRKRSITYVNAGHVEPFVISGRSVHSLNSGGFLTGFIPDAVYEKGNINLKPGDVLVAFTDGVPEVSNRSNEEFGRKGLIDLVKSHRHLSVRDLTEVVFSEIKRHSDGRRFHDDFTLLLLKAR